MKEGKGKKGCCAVEDKKYEMEKQQKSNGIGLYHYHSWHVYNTPAQQFSCWYRSHSVFFFPLKPNSWFFLSFSICLQSPRWAVLLLLPVHCCCWSLLLTAVCRLCTYDASSGMICSVMLLNGILNSGVPGSRYLVGSLRGAPIRVF